MLYYKTGDEIREGDYVSDSQGSHFFVDYIDEDVGEIHLLHRHGAMCYHPARDLALIERELYGDRPQCGNG